MRSIDRGFTLIELLVVLLTSSVLLAAIGGFYVTQQRHLRHQQVEIETSQSLRAALEQMSLDLRTAGYNPTPPTFVPFITADVASVEFKLDQNGDGTYDSTLPAEHKGFRRTGSTIESCQATAGGCSWATPLADFVATTGTIFTYFDCAGLTSGTPLTAPVTGGNLSNIARVDMALTVTRPVISGRPVSRTQSVSVRVRNKTCP